MADRTVSTVEEIEALLERTVVLDAMGDVWQRRDGLWWASPTESALSSSIVPWAPLTVLVPEQEPPAHLHDWRLAERLGQSVVRERCYDCGAQQIRDPQL